MQKSGLITEFSGSKLHGVGLNPGGVVRYGAVGILGTPVSSSNRGVLALGESLMALVLEADSDASFSFLLGHHGHEKVRMRPDGRERFVPIIPARLSPRSAWCDHLATIVLLSLLYRLFPIRRVRQAISQRSPWIQHVLEARLIGDIRGGDSFSDIYGMERFLIGSFMAWSAILVKGGIVQFPQTFGPFKSRSARAIARYLLRRSSAVFARDQESQRVAQGLMGPGQQVLLSPDVAFALKALVPNVIELDPPLPHPQSSTLHPQPVIGLNINGLMFNGGYTRKNMFGLKLDYPAFLSRLIEELLRESKHEIWLVPHTFAAGGSVESDPEACRRVRCALPPNLQARVRIVTREYDCHEIKGVIGLCDFFIGSRMHACIAALSQGIPCVGIAYSMKFKGVFETVDMSDWVIDGRNSDNEQAIARVIECYRNRDRIREPLRLRAQAARDNLRGIFKTLLGHTISGTYVRPEVS